MMNENEWDLAKFHNEMKKSGWIRISPGNVYVHAVSRRIFNPFAKDEDSTEMPWEKWAAQQQTPPPF